MRWTDIFGPILVLVVLGGIFWFMFGRKEKPSGDQAATPWVRDFFDSTFLAGLLSAVALGELVQNVSQGQANGWVTGAVAGAGVGALFALLSFGGRWNEGGVFTELLSLTFGAIGIGVSIHGLFEPKGFCTAADIGQDVLTFLAVALALAVGAALAWARNLFALNKLGPALLAAYGALQVGGFLVSPLGVSLVDIGVTGWVVALGAALALGFAAAIWPEFVLAVAGIAIAVATIVGTFTGTAGSLCTSPTTDASGLAPLIGYVGLYLIVRSVVGRSTGKKVAEKESVG